MAFLREERRYFRTKNGGCLSLQPKARYSPRMQSRWSQSGAREAVGRWGDVHGEAFAQRMYTARLLGADPDLVLHGGGNVSVKGARRTLLGDEQAVIHVKGSGCDLSDLEPTAMPAIDLGHLRRLRALTALSDEQMVNEIRTHLIDADAPTPSIETLLHAFLPHRFVDHSHADAVLVLTNQPHGEGLIRQALGDRVAIVPYVNPGFELAQAVAKAVERQSNVEGVVLLMHGLVTFGDTARESYERHIALVDACERFAGGSGGLSAGAATDSRLPAAPFAAVPENPAGALVSRIAPTLRGLLAHPTGDEDQPYRRAVLEWRASEHDLAFASSPEASALCDTGPLVSDHLIRTKPWFLYLDAAGSSADDPRAACRSAIDRYKQKYTAYVVGCGGDPVGLDAAPLVVIVPGAGLLCWGPTKKDALIAADIAQHTVRVKMAAARIGGYQSLPPHELFAMEYRDLQRRKLSKDAALPLVGQVVAVSGGAGAIGVAIAEACLEAGAHVALTDRDKDRLQAVVERLRESFPNAILGIAMDVTDETSVRQGYAEIVRSFGGVDVIVPNAGIAHVAPIDELKPADFRRVMEVNATGTFLFMQAGIEILKQQGLGGHVIINASKNVFGPGKDFGAYSASKAAGHQLGKVAAIELADHGIRVNMINADAVFGDETNPSGLWKEVGPQRAQSRNLKIADLPEYYRQRNLLKTWVRGRHVGNAVVFFARNATPTTGATLPVDGGVVEAFPR